MNRPLRSAPAGQQPADAEHRLRRTRRGAALGLVFAGVLATGAATGSWGHESADERAQGALRTPAVDPAANSRAADGPPGRAGVPAASVPGYDSHPRDVSRSGDRWSSVYSRREYDGFRSGLEGQYVGVGLWARRMPDGTITVDRVQSDSPAARAGVRPGDRLRTIDGVPVTGRPVTEVVARLRGDVPSDQVPAAPGAGDAGTGQAPPPAAATPPPHTSPPAAGTPSEPGPTADRSEAPATGEGAPAGGDAAQTAAPGAADPGAARDETQTDPDGTPARTGDGAGDTGTPRAADSASPARTGHQGPPRRGAEAGGPERGDAAHGPAGSEVVLGLERAGRQWTETLRRSRLAARNVTVKRLTSGEPDATRIKVDAFTKDTGDQVRRAVRTAPDGDALLLDLRGNSGGLVTEAVDAASAFLDGGLVATYDIRGDQRVLNAKPGGDTETPLVVLVDGGTMSAGELVTGALQDRGRAVVVGSQTFGKGSVQLPTERPDGSVAEETVGHYRTPAGRGVEGVGITPDLAAGDDAEQRAQSVLSGLGGGA